MEKVKLVVATTNKGKLKEIRVVLKNLPIELLTLEDIGFNEGIVEDKDSFEGNAIVKATVVAKKSNYFVMADDSGLEVDALDGAPGIYSARYAGEGADDKKNNIKLLEELASIPKEKRTARFRCVIALATPSEVIGTADGVCEGSIDFKEEGQNGFGYDSLFIPEGYDQTFGCIESEIKNKISHRAQALKKLAQLVQKKISKLV